jgi:hypothetical protein
MRLAGRWLAIVPLTAITLLAIGITVEGLFRQDQRYPVDIIPFVITTIPLVIPGAALWLAGWIVQGFANDTPQNPD